MHVIVRVSWSDQILEGPIHGLGGPMGGADLSAGATPEEAMDLVQRRLDIIQKRYLEGSTPAFQVYYPKPGYLVLYPGGNISSDNHALVPIAEAKFEVVAVR